MIRVVFKKLPTNFLDHKEDFEISMKGLIDSGDILEIKYIKKMKKYKQKNLKKIVYFTWTTTPKKKKPKCSSQYPA